MGGTVSGPAELLLGLYLLALAWAAASDVLRFLIPNALPAALAGLFLLGGALYPERADWVSHLAGAAAALLGGALAFHFGKWGGGDVKLIAAVALWTGLAGLLDLMIATALAGGALALVLVVLRRWTAAWAAAHADAAALPRVLRAGEGVPYGLAIAIGGALTAPQIPLFRALG